MSETFQIVHGPWNRAPKSPPQPGVTGHQVREGGLVAYRLEVERGGSSAWAADRRQTLIQVVGGRVQLRVFGNTIDLDPVQFAAIPPNIPFELVNPGRDTSTILVLRC